MPGSVCASALGRETGMVGGWCPLSQLLRSLQHSMPESQGDFCPGTVTAELSSRLLWFHQSPPPPPRYSGTEVAGEPRYLHHLFPLPSPPPEEGKSSATALNKHLLLSPLFSQEQLCHQLPTAHIHEQPEAFPFHQGIASSQCRWEQGQAWRAAAK